MENSTIRLMLGQTVQSTIELRLPARIHSMSVFHLTVAIRDAFDSITEVSLQPVIIHSDHSTVTSFIDAVQNSGIGLENDTIGRLLNSTDKNTVGQLVTLLSELFNENNDQYIELARLSIDHFSNLMKPIDLFL